MTSSLLRGAATALLIAAASMSAWAADEADAIEPDQPGIVESSSTVGKGRALLETLVDGLTQPAVLLSTPEGGDTGGFTGGAAASRAAGPGVSGGACASTGRPCAGRTGARTPRGPCRTPRGAVSRPAPR